MRKRRTKIFVIYLLVSLALSTIQLFGQSTPPTCNGQYEPGYSPDCGPSPSCVIVNPNNCNDVYGWRHGYCCYIAIRKCWQVNGSWRCCNNQWQRECKSVQTVYSVCSENKCKNN